jgi:hypothetical protein
MVDADDARPAPSAHRLVDPSVKALLMNVLMLSAAFGLPLEIIFIKELGIGTALAAIIDATLIRALLVPSLWRCSAKRTYGRQRRCGA